MNRRVLVFLALVFALFWLSTDGDLFLGRAPERNFPVRNEIQTDRNPANISDPTVQSKQEPKIASPDTNQLTQKLMVEAKKMGQVDPNPSATKARLKSWASGLNRKELQHLRQLGLNKDLNPDERFLSVFLIGLNDTPAAAEELRLIVSSPVGPAPEERAYSDELSIRLHALEQMVRKLPADQSAKYLRQILASSDNPVIARQALMWLKRFG